MEVTFLGTGAAFSPHAYNAAILSDRTILMDAGAPLTVHLPKAGGRPGRVAAAELSAELGPLVAASDHVITEMTYDEGAGGSMHLGRTDVEGLMQRHPSTRFIITHRGSNGSVNGATIARDFLTL